MCHFVSFTILLLSNLLFKSFELVRKWLLPIISKWIWTRFCCEFIETELRAHISVNLKEKKSVSKQETTSISLDMGKLFAILNLEMIMNRMVNNNIRALYMFNKMYQKHLLCSIYADTAKIKEQKDWEIEWKCNRRTKKGERYRFDSHTCERITQNWNIVDWQKKKL